MKSDRQTSTPVTGTPGRVVVFAGACLRTAASIRFDASLSDEDSLQLAMAYNADFARMMRALEAKLDLHGSGELTLAVAELLVEGGGDASVHRTEAIKRMRERHEETRDALPREVRNAIDAMRDFQASRGKVRVWGSSYKEFEASMLELYQRTKIQLGLLGLDEARLHTAHAELIEVVLVAFDAAGKIRG